MRHTRHISIHNIKFIMFRSTKSTGHNTKTTRNMHVIPSRSIIAHENVWIDFENEEQKKAGDKLGFIVW